MNRSDKLSPETRASAVRMVQEHRGEYPSLWMAVVHHVECTAANVAGVTQVHALLHGRKDTMSGDSGYTGVESREEMAKVNARFLIAEKRSKVQAIGSKRERKRAERWERK